LLPAIIKLKTSSIEVYERSLTSLYRMLVGLGVLFALITIFCSDFLIIYSFGPKFLEAKYSLIILMLAAPFIALRTLSVRYMIVEGYENKIASRTIITLIINVILNILLIPLFGIEGAAFSTLISLFIGSYLINYWDSDLSQLRRICNNSFFIKSTFKGSKV
jgi:O-antigen/teichoic acid export membrane protein